MTNPQLIVNAQTVPGHFDQFLKSVSDGKKAHGNLHLRAYETISKSPDGTTSSVRILFVRSGRETPLEWLRNAWNRKSQYRLAAKVLKDVGGFETDITNQPVIPGVQRPNYRAMSKEEKEAAAERLITISSLMKEVTPKTLDPVAPLKSPAAVKSLQTPACVGRTPQRAPGFRFDCFIEDIMRAVRL